MHLPSWPRSKTLLLALERGFGSAKLEFLVLVLLLGVCVNLFSNGVYNLFGGLPGNLTWQTLLSLGVPIVLLLILSCGARHAAHDLRVSFHKEDKPNQTKCLILFLSTLRPPTAPKTEDEKLIESGVDGLITDVAVRGRFRGSTRMPLEAIAFHVGRLKRVIVVPSPSSLAALPQFKSLVERLSKDLPSEQRFEVLGVGECTIPGDAGEPALLPEAVDFEDADGVAHILHDLYRALKKRDFPGKEVLMDITGGQKINSIAGVTMAMWRRWRFQYVSTNGFKVMTYDIDYTD